MKTFFKIIAPVLPFLFSVGISAQMPEDPTTWTYEVKKINAHEYELVFHVVLNKGWHVFSQEPGDEFLIPPSFDFSKNKNIQLIGKMEERGNLKKEKMEGIDNVVSYFESEAWFTQKVQLKGKTTIRGEHEYQVCSENLCLPPKKKEFRFVIK